MCFFKILNTFRDDMPINLLFGSSFVLLYAFFASTAYGEAVQSASGRYSSLWSVLLF